MFILLEVHSPIMQTESMSNNTENEWANMMTRLHVWVLGLPQDTSKAIELLTRALVNLKVSRRCVIWHSFYSEGSYGLERDEKRAIKL